MKERLPQEMKEEIEAYIRSMPSLSTTMSKVMAICNNPLASANDLNRVISLDPVLTGKVLKLINSAYYAHGEPIKSLTRAIIIRGLNTIKNLALSSAIVGTMRGKGKSSSELMDDFWQHSLATGVITRIMAVYKGVPSQEREEYFVAGFLHDLGKIPLMSLYPDRYRELMQKCDMQDQVAIHHREEDTFGVGHCHIGTLIAGKWHLAPQITNAIRDHHLAATGPDNTDNYTLLVAQADIIAHGLNPKRASVAPKNILDDHIRLTGIDPATIPALSELVAQELEKAKIFLELN